MTSEISSVYNFQCQKLQTWYFARWYNTFGIEGQSDKWILGTTTYEKDLFYIINYVIVYDSLCAYSINYRERENEQYRSYKHVQLCTIYS